MATGTKKCKICGVDYPYCKTPSKPGVFRWQDVACCEEHGRQYLAEILASRGETAASAPSPAVATVQAEPTVAEVVAEPVAEEAQAEQPVAEATEESTTKRKKSRRKFLAAEESVAETNE